MDTPLKGMRVLVVEDDYFLATDIQAALSTQGAEVVGPIADVRPALRTLSQSPGVDAAILDIDLRGDMAYPVALALEEQRIPFVFATGYTSGRIPSRFAAIRRLEKPFPVERVAATLLERLREKPAAAPSAPVESPGPKPLAIPFLTRLQRCTPLDEADRQVLRGICAHPRWVSARQEIVREGEHNSLVRLVLDGFAYRYKTLVDGSRSIVGFSMPGDLCHLHGSILGQADHSIATLSDCLVVDLSPETMDRLTSEARIGRALAWSALVDEAVLRAWLVNIGARRGPKRMAHFLMEWFTRLETVSLVQNGSCAFPLTQEDLAQSLGMATVHVNRTLQHLRKSGLVTVQKHVLTILDRHKLSELGGFSPAYLHLRSDA
jgi:CRP-like cAMP-binding protein